MILLKSRGGSKIRLLQTAFQLHDRTAEEVEEHKYTTQLGGRRSSTYCENVYLPPLFPQMSLTTMHRRPKTMSTHAIVTYRTRVIHLPLPRGSQVTSAMNRLASQLRATQNPSEIRRVANVVQVINTNRIWHCLTLPFCFSCSSLVRFVGRRRHTVCLSRTSAGPLRNSNTNSYRYSACGRTTVLPNLPLL